MSISVQRNYDYKYFTSNYNQVWMNKIWLSKNFQLCKIWDNASTGTVIIEE